MYFIPRNNKIYSYIAHTSSQRRYGVTLIAISMFFIIGIYILYYSLTNHIALLKLEYIVLQKKHTELIHVDKGNLELHKLIELGKKNINQHIILPEMYTEYCHKQMLFILNLLNELNIMLNGYGSCQEIVKDWYTKDIVHFETNGSFQNLMIFLETIKNSHKMIVIPQINISRLPDNQFKMNLDAELIMIKK
ncbi:MAG TPA: hypothetical protein VLB80_00240 [Candidatus Babeliales bacterium]|nr:hypothetical protein [Candidatus Babeliales bacterium]